MSVRTIVVIDDTETGTRHVMEVAAEATVTYSDPDPWERQRYLRPPPPHRLELDGAILRHHILKLGDDPTAVFDERPAIEPSLPEITGS